MNAVTTLPERAPRSVLVDMATRFGMEPGAFEATVRATCMPGQNVTREHFAAFLLVAKEYGLNPLTKELYAFPAKGGGIQPIVSIDGWMNMINAHPQFDGMEFDDIVEDGKLTAVACRIYRKDRSRPTSVIEYMAECRRNTDVWRQWPARMLRHKAAIQAARYAFGFSGVMEPDEYERMKDVTPAQPQTSGLSARLSGARGPGFNHAQIERTVAGDETPALEHDEPRTLVVDDADVDASGRVRGMTREWANADRVVTKSGRVLKDKDGPVEGEITESSPEALAGSPGDEAGETGGDTRSPADPSPATAGGAAGRSGKGRAPSPDARGPEDDEPSHSARMKASEAYAAGYRAGKQGRPRKPGEDVFPGDHDDWFDGFDVGREEREARAGEKEG